MAAMGLNMMGIVRVHVIGAGRVGMSVMAVDRQRVMVDEGRLTTD